MTSVTWAPGTQWTSSGPSCNGGTDSCAFTTNDANCANGLYCDGAETCDPMLDCQAGSDPCSGSQTCDEEGDVCVGPGGCLHEVDFESGAGGTCIVVSPVYSVTEASDVAVWYFHGQRDAGDDAGDFFSLEISTDGGGCSHRWRVSQWSTVASARSGDSTWRDQDGVHQEW